MILIINWEHTDPYLLAKINKLFCYPYHLIGLFSCNTFIYEIGVYYKCNISQEGADVIYQN